MDNNFDFNKNNIQYSWLDEEYITTFTKKSESGNLVYLVCSKRGTNGNACPGKAKFDRKKGIFMIYKKFNDENNIHKRLNFYDFLNNIKK